MTALEIAAKEMSMGDSRPKDVRHSLEETENQTIYSQLLDHLRKFVHFCTPVEAVLVSEDDVQTADTSCDTANPSALLPTPLTAHDYGDSRIATRDTPGSR